MKQRRSREERMFMGAIIACEQKKGHVLWVRDKGKITERDKENKPVTVTGLHYDITVRKELELMKEEKHVVLRIRLNKGQRSGTSRKKLLRERISP